MISQIEKNTFEYQKKVSKKDRKSKAQFFTTLSIAQYMSSLSDVAVGKENLNILDCGAGTGILTCSLIDKLIEEGFDGAINVDLYENDEKVIGTLSKNMKLYTDKYKNLTINIIQDNFILSNKEAWMNDGFEGIYDIVISNPPYKKLVKLSEESIAMSKVVHGQPNIYFLFMAMSIKLLKTGGEMIFITPRSFTSGAYFKAFRRYLLDNTVLTNIHIFNSRNNLFKGEEVLQETVITRAIKAFSGKVESNLFMIVESPEICVTVDSEKENIKYDISLTISEDADFDHMQKIDVCCSDLITGCDNRFILLPSSLEEVEILKKLCRYTDNLTTLGFKLKTGKVVDFRAGEYLTQEKDGAVPLFWPDNFIDNRITFVSNEDNFRYVISSVDSKSILQENKDYILVKRFTSKEESRRIQPALYNHVDFNDFDKIGVENHVNFIEKEKGYMSMEEQYGIFCYFNSTIVDKYYRIINGNTQVNATEFNAIPMPAIDVVIAMGKDLLNSDDINTDTCNSIIEKYI